MELDCKLRVIFVGLVHFRGFGSFLLIGLLENRFDDQVGIKDFHMEGWAASPSLKEDNVSRLATLIVPSFMEFSAFGPAHHPISSKLIAILQSPDPPERCFPFAHEKSPLDSTYHHHIVMLLPSSSIDPRPDEDRHD